MRLITNMRRRWEELSILHSSARGTAVSGRGTGLAGKVRANERHEQKKQEDLVLGRPLGFRAASASEGPVVPLAKRVAVGEG